MYRTVHYLLKMFFTRTTLSNVKPFRILPTVSICVILTTTNNYFIYTALIGWFV